VPSRHPVPLQWWDGADATGASAAVTTRRGGVSAAPYDSLNLGLHVGDRRVDVVENRGRAAASFGVDLSTMVFARQVHGTGVAKVGPAERGRGATDQDDAVADCDVLLTTAPGVTLAILVADCVPLVLVDPDVPVMAAVHAGWRGTAAGVVGAAVRAMAEEGAAAERVRAYLGPAVDPRRYQVTDDVRDALAVAVAPAPLEAGIARADGPGHWLADLVAANRQQLEQAGLDPGRIHAATATTADDDFFSDRAARPCGRFGLLARLLS
jgi:YfiH family protein